MSVLKAFAGMTASVVSTVALAIVPFKASDPAPSPAGDLSFSKAGGWIAEVPFGRAVFGVRPRRRGDEAACRIGGRSSGLVIGETGFVVGSDAKPF